jgi:hypothetical protein
MVKEDMGWTLEKGDEIIVFNKKSKKAIAEGKFRAAYCVIVSHIEKGKYNNGSFVGGFHLTHEDNSVHAYSFELFKFKLKNELKPNI